MRRALDFAPGQMLNGPMTSSGAALDMEGVTKRFGTVTAVDSLSWQVPAGAVVGLIGPNGAGNTTCRI